MSGAAGVLVSPMIPMRPKEEFPRTCAGLSILAGLRGIHGVSLALRRDAGHNSRGPILTFKGCRGIPGRGSDTSQNLVRSSSGRMSAICGRHQFLPLGFCRLFQRITACASRRMYIRAARRTHAEAHTMPWSPSHRHAGRTAAPIESRCPIGNPPVRRDLWHRPSRAAAPAPSIDSPFTACRRPFMDEPPASTASTQCLRRDAGRQKQPFRRVHVDLSRWIAARGNHTSQAQQAP